MWKTQLVDGAKYVTDDTNLLPLLSELNTSQKIVISTIGNGVVRATHKKSSLKGKGLQSLAKVNLLFLTLVVAGIFSLSLSCLFMYNSLYDWIMADMLEMRSFSPIYPMWTDPPHLVTFSVNILEAVNHEEFLASEDPNVKLEMRDVGPIVYREHMKHTNVTHHDNGTMSFISVRYVEFLEDHNEPGILNRTITVPNFGLIGALSFLHELSFFSKLAFNVMLNSAEEPIFINITVYDFLWNYNSDVITLANKVLPMLVPVTNLGILHRIYDGYADHVNVKVGKKNGFENFFNIQTYNYQTNIPGFDPKRDECNATVVDANEAILFSRHMTNETVINYFRKSICQNIPLHYDRSSELMGLKVHEFVLRPESLRRKANLTADCFKGPDADAHLPDGLTDMSRCYFNFPMVLSLPHFIGAEDGAWNDRLSGLKVEPEKHQSRIYAEPVLGVGVKQVARSQVNTFVRDLSGFPQIFQRFSNMVIPIFWGELMLKEPPAIPFFMMTFCVKYLPFIDHVVVWLFVGVGLMLWIFAMKITFR